MTLVTTVSWSGEKQLELASWLASYAAKGSGGGVPVAQVVRAAVDEYRKKHDPPEVKP